MNLKERISGDISTILILGFAAIVVLVSFLIFPTNPVLQFGAPVVALFCFLAFLYPRIGFWGFLVLVPTTDFLKRFQIAFTTPTNLEWTIVLALPDLILVSISLSLVFRKLTMKDIAIKVKSAEIWLVFLFLSAAMSSFLTILPIVISISAFKLSAFYLLAYFCAAQVIRNRRDFQKLLLITLSLSLIALVYGIIQSLFGMTAFEQKWLLGGYTGLDYLTIFLVNFRPFSILNSPLAYACYLVIGMISLILLEKETKIPFALFILLIILFMIGLLTTQVRSALALLLFALAFYAWYSRKRSAVFPLILIVTIIFFSVTMMVKFRDPLNALALKSGQPLIQRLLIVGTLSDRFRGWEQLLARPGYISLLGYGLGTTNSTLMAKNKQLFAYFSHDQYTGLLLEQGLIGLTLFFGFLISWFKKVEFFDRSKDGSNKRLLISFQIGVLLMGLFGSFLNLSPINIYFWIISAILLRWNDIFPAQAIER